MDEMKGNTKADEALKAALAEEYADASGYIGDIIKERSDNLKYYEMNPVNIPTVDGRSKVKTSDVADIVDWIMPQLQKLLVSHDAPVEFEAMSEDDIEPAKQETAYIKHVLDKNRFFVKSVVWHKDALIQKNGVLKVFWEENNKKVRERYNNVSEIQLEALRADDDIEIFEVEEVEQLQVELMPMMAPGFEQSKYYNVTAFRSKDCSEVRIDNVAPENFFVRRGWNSIFLDEIPYCAHREKVSLSELRLEGFSEQEVEELEEGATDISDATGEIEDRLFREGGDWPEASGDKTQRDIWVTEHFIRYDYDDDGVDELIKVRTVGDGGGMRILDKCACDSIPFVTITPEIMSHTFWGRAIADNLKQIQDIKTVLLRQTLDNIYLTNEPRPIVNKSMVDLDSLYNTEVGAPIYTKGPGAIEPFAIPFMGGNTLALFEYIDSMREERTGVSKQTQGLDPAALRDQTNLPAMKLITASQERILMIARVFAEVGYVGLYLKIHELLLKNEKAEKVFELRGKYVPVNPREWVERSSMRVLAGTGNQSKDEKLSAMTQILNYQEKIVQAQGGAVGIVNMQNIHSALMEFCELAGIKNGETFFTPVDMIQPMPEQSQQTDSATEVAMVDIQTRAQTEARKIELEARKTTEELSLKREVEGAKIQLEREKILLEKQMKEMELSLRAEIEALKLQSQILQSEKNDIRELERERESPMQNESEDEETSGIKVLEEKIQSLEEKLNTKKAYNFNYDKQGKIVSAESEVVAA